MTITYSVDTSFGLHQVNGSDYIQSNKFSAKIKHPGLKNFLGYLLKNQIASVTQTELSRMAKDWNIDKAALQEFLVAQTGLFKINISENKFSTLAVFGEGDVIEQVCAAFHEKFGLTIERCAIGQQVTTADTIILHYSSFYDPKQIEAVYTASTDANNYFVTAYLMSEYLIIDNIYSRQSGLPCHFCHQERLKSNSSLVPNGQTKSWLNYYREMLKENKSALFEKIQPSIYSNYIAYCLYQFMRRLLDPFCPEWHYDQYIQFWNVHLDKMTITKEAGSFWPYCACQNK